LEIVKILAESGEEIGSITLHNGLTVNSIQSAINALQRRTKEVVAGDDESNDDIDLTSSESDEEDENCYTDSENGDTIITLSSEEENGSCYIDPESSDAIISLPSSESNEASDGLRIDKDECWEYNKEDFTITLKKNIPATFSLAIASDTEQAALLENKIEINCCQETGTLSASNLLTSTQHRATQGQKKVKHGVLAFETLKGPSGKIDIPINKREEYKDRGYECQLLYGTLGIFALGISAFATLKGYTGSAKFIDEILLKGVTPNDYWSLSLAVMLREMPTN